MKSPMLTSPSSEPSQDPIRRLQPKLVDPDWLVMKCLARAVSRLAATIASPGAVVIDFGCGSMPYRPVFTSLGCQYLGADLGEGQDLIVDTDGFLCAAADSADILVSFQVLEHVRDIDRYLGEAVRVLRPDGRLLLSTHGTWLYHPHPEDYRRWTRVGLIHEIESRGFEVVEYAPVVGPLAWTTVLRLIAWTYAVKRVPFIGKPLAALLALTMNLRAVVEDAVTPAAVASDNACVYVVVARPRGGGN